MVDAFPAASCTRLPDIQTLIKSAFRVDLRRILTGDNSAITTTQHCCLSNGYQIIHTPTGSVCACVCCLWCNSVWCVLAVPVISVYCRQLHNGRDVSVCVCVSVCLCVSERTEYTGGLVPLLLRSAVFVGGTEHCIFLGISAAH